MNSTARPGTRSAAGRTTPTKHPKKPAKKSAKRSAKTRAARAEVYNLRLYVAGQTPKSLEALANLRDICESHLAGCYRIEVIDLLEKPQLASGDQILAIPTLVRRLPTPLKRIIGDLSNVERVLIGLDLRRA